MSARGGLLTLMSGKRPAPVRDYSFLTTIDPLWSFTRSGSESRYIDPADGLMKQAAADVPRLTAGIHLPGSTEALGTLLEVGRTNRCLHNTDFSNAAWVKTNVTVNNDAVGLSGASTASRLTAGAANATVIQSITRANASSVFSVYLKRVVGSGNIQLTNDGGSTWTTVTVTSSWTRVQVIQTVTNLGVGIRIVTSGDQIAASFAQEEAGAFSTSPILTAGSSVARGADVCFIGAANFSAFYKAGQGALFSEFIFNTPIYSAARASCSISDNTNNEQFLHYLDNAAGVPALRIVDGGSNVANLTGGALAVDTVHKMVLTWHMPASRAEGNIDGTPTAVDSSISDPTVTRLVAGAQGATSSGQLNGYLRRIKYFDKKLTPGHCAQLVAA